MYSNIPSSLWHADQIEADCTPRLFRPEGVALRALCRLCTAATSYSRRASVSSRRHCGACSVIRTRL